MKAIVSVGYKNYIMDAEKALAFLSMLEDAEVYESKWVDKNTAHFVYPQDGNDTVREMRLVPEALYRMAKLAGKPNDK